MNVCSVFIKITLLWTSKEKIYTVCYRTKLTLNFALVNPNIPYKDLTQNVKIPMFPIRSFKVSGLTGSRNSYIRNSWLQSRWAKRK